MIQPIDPVKKQTRIGKCLLLIFEKCKAKFLKKVHQLHILDFPPPVFGSCFLFFSSSAFFYGAWAYGKG
jgi:hypothetical protein